VGDTIQIPTGVRVPVDGYAIDQKVLTDRSFLTGESAPVWSADGDILRAGEINVGAPFHLKASAVGEDTSLRQMAALVETAENARNSYTSIADKAARIYAPAVHILALVTFLGWLIISGDVRHSLNVAIAVLIITCPCALGLAVPAVATAAIGKLFDMGFLVKSGTALERLANVDHIIFDKTGTLTLPGQSFDLSKLDHNDRAIAKALAQSSAHPISVALTRELADVKAHDISNISEIPGKGIEAIWNGQRAALGRGDWLGSEQSDLTLLVGERLQNISTFEIMRPGVPETVASLQGSGMRVTLLSGDTRQKTKALAQKLGVSSWIAAVTPQEKHDIVMDRQNGENKAMVGDGINDAAALAAAHVSIAPGSALDVARNAADIVLLRQSFQALPTLLEIAKASVRLSKQNFAIAALYNAIAIPVAVLGFATPMLAALAMSASSITVLLNAIRVRLIK